MSNRDSVRRKHEQDYIYENTNVPIFASDFQKKSNAVPIFSSDLPDHHNVANQFSAIPAQQREEGKSFDETRLSDNNQLKDFLKDYHEEKAKSSL